MQESITLTCVDQENFNQSIFLEIQKGNNKLLESIWRNVQCEKEKN